MRCAICGEPIGNADRELWGPEYAHRTCVIAFNAGKEDGKSTEYGWLVENGKQGDELRYRTWRDGLPEWTADHNEATRYCRRIDAERAHQEDEDAWRIVQHAWDDMPPSDEQEPMHVEDADGPDRPQMECPTCQQCDCLGC